MTSITITDVARRAGVSMKTVSRVLNREPHVREEVRERVHRAAKELRYRPKVSARSLAGSKSYLVGYLLHQVNPYAANSQLGALTACREAGYHLLVESVDLASPTLKEEMQTLTSAMLVDGMILLPPISESQVVMDVLDEAGVAYVRISPATGNERSFYVEVDDEGAASVMTRHLLELGHRRIAFVGGPAGHAASTRRLAGFRAAMSERGINVRPELIETGQFSFESGDEAAARLLALDEPPTAVFASNDLTALGVMARARALGVVLPDQLSVAGFDDIQAAGMVWPPLTTMRQPMAEMAALAAEAIIARAGKDAAVYEPDHRTLRCELMVRGSTAPPRAG
jgi:LacI family transcriptional regulator